LDYLQEEIEETYFDKYQERLAELDKSWDALHRCLTDGYLKTKPEHYPGSYVILGGEELYGEEDYIMVLKTPAEVNEIAKFAGSVTEEYIKEKYYQIPVEDYGFELNEDDCGYTWEWFNASKEFWKKAASENRYVLFSVDQ
ncbi:MAG: YfbM family protein, partial [Tannerellaceae bacterium]|nr:YfbM family protein [Tannerellaceae bacterium]